jgi:3-oxoacyl-[acyl-carrier-protein] synthase-3
MVFPATANISFDKIGAVNAWGFDLEAACSGFLYGLTTGAA